MNSQFAFTLGLLWGLGQNSKPGGNSFGDRGDSARVKHVGDVLMCGVCKFSDISQGLEMVLKNNVP